MQDETRAVALLKQYGLTVALAESCTGGMAAARLTAVPGCSDVFGTGVVSYSWECKRQLLGVSRDTLEVYGAVSAETAREMADGIRKRADASIGVAITGEAGPQSAEGQPVGTVFIAVATDASVEIDECHFEGNRDEIRQRAVAYALDKLCHTVMAMVSHENGGIAP